MKIMYGYKCNKCGQILPIEKESNLPLFCTKCGADLIKERYYYNRTPAGEETRETNLFGGYDYVKTVLHENAVRTKIYKEHFYSLFWKEYNEN